MAGTESPQREAVKQAYPSDKWADKVKKMSDAQLAAVYLRLKAAGKVA